MTFPYYHNTGQPAWGSSDFRFAPPPAPGFQPQPTWGGNDFYRAHAATDDPYLFDHAWNRVREYGGAPDGMGVGLHEARLMHRRAYGANEMNYMSPEEIGHAAAYEAYRTWIHNRFMYQHLHDDIERQREALTGLAVAEASRLLNFRSIPGDQYARLTSTEAAAHTASYIFYQTRNEEYRSRSYTRSNDDPYAFDDELLYPSSGRSRSRHRSRHPSMSRHRSLSRPRSYSQMGYSGSGYGGSTYGGGSAYGGSAYGGSAYGGSAYGGGSSYSPPQSAVYPPTPYPAGSYAGSVGNSFGNGIPIPGSSYGVPISAGSSYGGGVLSSSYGAGGVLSSSYGAGGMLSSSPYTSQFPTYQSGVPMDYTRTRSASFSYPQQQYYPQQYVQQPYIPGVATSANTMPGGGQLVIIQKPSKRRKHRRAPSSDREYGRR